MHFLSLRIFEQLELDLKNRVAQKFFALLNILFTFRIFEQLALALKNRGCPQFTVLNVYFLLFRIFEQLALAPKNKVVLEFFTVLNIHFLSLRIFEQLEIALKNRVAQKFFAVLNILFTFRIVEQLALALNNRGCPEFIIFNVNFNYSGFLSNLRLPWNFSLYWIYFLHSQFLSNLRLPWKTEGALNSLYWMYIFYHSEFLSNLRLPWNQSLQPRGAADPPTRTPMVWINWKNKLTWARPAALKMFVGADHISDFEHLHGCRARIDNYSENITQTSCVSIF